MALLLLTISVILTIFAVGMLQVSLHCLRKANQALLDAIEIHLAQHRHEVGPPEDWNDWRPDR